MKKGMAVRFLLVSTLFVLIAACAKISAPSGGLRDRTPPVVLKTIPVYGAKNFRGKNIYITFDEYVALDNMNDKFMVSPPMKKKPKVFIRGKNVVTEYEDDLRDSTTYTFYYQDGIKDLNEGNVLENYQFVFSTGSIVDSLSVTGNVATAFSLDPPEKTMVLLYRELADTNVIKHLPDYISRVDQEGYFRINNVKEGTYRLYALKESDNSKSYNLPDEEFAFMSEPINVTPENDFIPVVKDTVIKKKEVIKIKETAGKKPQPVQDTIVQQGKYPLVLFAARKKNHYLTSSSRPYKYQLSYTLSLPPDSLDFRLSIPGAGNNSFFIEKNIARDTIKVWLTDSTLYSKSQLQTIIDYPFTDTLGITSYKEDTINMRFVTPRPTRGAKIKKDSFKYETNIRSNFLKPGQQIVFTSLTPFRQPDTSRIRLYQVSDSVRNIIPYEITKDNLNSCRLLFKTDLLQGKKYLFIADSASFGNIFNDNADSSGINFSFKEPDSYSKLTMNVRNIKGDCIIQLLSSAEKLVSESVVRSDGKIEYPLLESGTYRLRIIFDKNGDGKWTTGDFSKGLQPEPVSFYPREIDIKTGWEIEQDWDIGKENYKEVKLRIKKTSAR